jgi:hypothetical protein
MRVVFGISPEELEEIMRQGAIALSPVWAGPLNLSPEIREATLDAQWAGTNEIQMEIQIPIEETRAGDVECATRKN